MKKRSISDMLIFIISAEIVGAVSALLSGRFSDFFEKYKEPPLLPPEWLFPVVWGILYAAMGYSAYLIYTSDAESSQKKTALSIYWAQLAINFLWSIVFFRFEGLWAAFAVIMALWVMIIAMILKFRKISPLAAYINIPYLLWVTFAAYLNLATAIIN
ncbi:MAG: tryptophan-rich sensory protein [Oscillospiraceae bacterium]|nr:tryptophan-rich sensory protein [Oscillospiraceae bacterium]